MALKKGTVTSAAGKKDSKSATAPRTRKATSKPEAEKPATETAPFDEGVPADEQGAAEVEQEPAEADHEAAALNHALGRDEQEQSSSGQELATSAPAKLPTKTASGGQVLTEMEEAGFEGLELGFGSFPIIALKTDGEFVDTEETSYDEEFLCVVNSSRTKYVVKNTKTEKDKDEEVVYTYDNVNDTNGVPLEETIADWAAEGWGYESKPYTEVFATLVDEEGEPGNSVLLSIPKTSRTRFTGYVAQQRMRKGLMPNAYVTRCLVGAKIQNVDFPFYPWSFEFVGELE